MSTDTSERGLERRICTALTGSPCDAAPRPNKSRMPKAPPHQMGRVGSAATRVTTTASTPWT